MWLTCCRCWRCLRPRSFQIRIGTTFQAVGSPAVGCLCFGLYEGGRPAFYEEDRAPSIQTGCPKSFSCKSHRERRHGESKSTETTKVSEEAQRVPRPKVVMKGNCMDVSQVEVDSLSSILQPNHLGQSFCCKSDAPYPALSQESSASMHVLPNMVPKRPLQVIAPKRTVFHRKRPCFRIVGGVPF